MFFGLAIIAIIVFVLYSKNKKKTNENTENGQKAEENNEPRLENDGAVQIKNERILGVHEASGLSSIRNSNVKHYDVPAGVTTILKKFDAFSVYGENAFENYPNLKTVSIPRSTVKVEWGAFDGCRDLESIEISQSNPAYKSVDGVVYSKDGSTLLYYPKGKKDDAFVIPDGVTELAREAIMRPQYLTELTVPASVKRFGKNAVFGGIKTIRYEGSAAEWSNIFFDAYNELLRGDVQLYLQGALAQEITVEGMDKIGNTFQSLNSLECLTVAEGVKEIERDAFKHCRNLTEITLPASLTRIGENAFADCPNVTDVYYTGTIEDWCAIGFENEKANPLSNEMGAHLHIGGVKVTEITLSSMESIGDFMFMGLIDLTHVTLLEGVKRIRTSAFQNCTHLQSVQFPESLQEIGNRAFSQCTALAEIQIPKRVARLGEGAFAGCSLKNVALPDNLTTIEQGVFTDCKRLESVSFPEKLLNIATGAFKDCRALKEVSLPDSLTKVDIHAFRGCMSLEKIQFAGTMARWREIAFLSWTDDLYVDTVVCCDGIDTTLQTKRFETLAERDRKEKLRVCRSCVKYKNCKQIGTQNCAAYWPKSQN